MLRSSWSSLRRPLSAGVLCTAVVLAVTVPASAEGWLDEDVHGGKGFFMIGWGALDLAPLNDALRAGGYPTFTEDFLTLGGGGHAIIGRFVLGGQGHAYVSQEHDATFAAGNYRTTVSAGTGFFDLGFVLWSNGSLLLTPLVGLGGGSVTLDIRELASPTFGEVLTQPGRRSTLATGGFLVDVGFTLDWIIDRGHGRGSGGPAVGVRVGWVISPIEGQWQLHEQDVAGGPGLGVDGPYVRVMLGGGGGDY